MRPCGQSSRADRTDNAVFPFHYAYTIEKTNVVVVVVVAILEGKTESREKPTLHHAYTVPAKRGGPTTWLNCHNRYSSRFIITDTTREFE